MLCTCMCAQVMVRGWKPLTHSLWRTSRPRWKECSSSLCAEAKSPRAPEQPSLQWHTLPPLTALQSRVSLALLLPQCLMQPLVPLAPLMPQLIHPAAQQCSPVPAPWTRNYSRAPLPQPLHAAVVAPLPLCCFWSVVLACVGAGCSGAAMALLTVRWRDVAVPALCPQCVTVLPASRVAALLFLQARRQCCVLLQPRGTGAAELPCGRLLSIQA
jgi:hypothetical protein